MIQKKPNGKLADALKSLVGTLGELLEETAHREAAWGSRLQLVEKEEAAMNSKLKNVIGSNGQMIPTTSYVV